MDAKSVQRLLAAANYYAGGIDGDVGPKTLKAIDAILKANVAKLAAGHERWKAPRRLIAAGQLVLDAMGYEPGAIDGLAGNNTREALAAYDFYLANGKREIVTRKPIKGYEPVKSKFPRQKECATFYGKPGKAVADQLVMIDLPMKFRIDYALGQTVSRISIHKKCLSSAKSAIDAIVSHYGEEDMRALGLDRFAGSYNHRKMRGGSSWSMHAYGCALDFYAGPNGLRVKAPDALFSGAAYVKFFDIWEDHGWTSLGRAIGRDWMHVQAASL